MFKFQEFKGKLTVYNNVLAVTNGVRVEEIYPGDYISLKNKTIHFDKQLKIKDIAKKDLDLAKLFLAGGKVKLYICEVK